MNQYRNYQSPENGPRVPQGAIDRSAYRFASAQRPPGGPTNTAPVQQQPAAAQPPKARPRGRILIAVLMFLVCSFGITTVWDSLLRYRAYGVVTGRIINVSSPVDGVVNSTHVREGEQVNYDTRLAIVRNLEHEQQLARIADELRIAEATLHAEMAKIRWRTHVEETETTRAIADMFQAKSQLHQINGQLEILDEQVEASEDLFRDGHLRGDTLNERVTQKIAATRMVEEIQKGLEVLRERAEKAKNIPRPGAEQMQPLVAKATLLLNDLKRLRGRIREGDLRSPVSGTVLERHFASGEAVDGNEPLFSLLEESSIEIEMFIPQDMTDQFREGETIRLKIEPHDELVSCRIVSIGKEHRKPPEHIEIFYRKAVRLLPVRLAPIGKLPDGEYLPIGAVAKLPFIGARG